MLRNSWARLGAIAVLAAAMVLMSASVALAVPDQTMGLVDLQSKLSAADASGVPLMGYMKTVDRGSTIETIPVWIENLSGPATDTADDFIIFEAQGAQIDRFGGIVAGMSGSPVYVTDDGVDKVVGAVSYGDLFTKGGTGLATPIERMLELLPVEAAPQVDVLAKPIMISGRVVDRIIVPTNPGAYKSQSQAGSAFVARSLTSYYIGGLNPSSPLYAATKADAVAHGKSVVDLGSTLSAGTSSFSTDLVPGAAVAALYARGDMWLGGIGTVTYADGDNVLVFGHPLDQSGPTSLYLMNAWITGVWPSLVEPYKMGYPAALRGTFTHDGQDGLLGDLTTTPPEVSVTAHSADVDNGHTADSNVSFTSEQFDSGQTSYYASDAASIAGYRLTDQKYLAGSALTTTTVVVSDSTGTYTVTMPDLWDSGSDIPGDLAGDVDYAVGAIQSNAGNGLSTPHIESVHVQSSISSVRKSAEIVDVAPESSLKVGVNKIRVSMLVYGVADTQTVETTLTIPRGTDLDGVLVAQSPYSSDGSGDGGTGAQSGSGGSSTIDDPSLSDGTSTDRETLAQTVDDLNTALPNNSVTVDFYSGADAQEQADSGDGTGSSIESTAVVPWVTDGKVSAVASSITAKTVAVPFGSDGLVMGDITGPSDPVTVYVYGTAAGETTESLLAIDEAQQDPDTGDLFYEIDVPELYTNTSLRVHIDGTADYSAADTNVMQYVRALVSLGTSAKSVKSGKKVTLTASVFPGECTGNATFQYYDSSRGAWRTIGTRPLVSGLSSARATLSWAPLKGSHKVRVVYGGCTLNYGNSSGSVTIAAK